MKAITLCLLIPVLASAEPPTATTSSGPITGGVRDGVIVFKSVPYGADTATTRFAPSCPLAPCTAPREGIEFGPMAV